MRDMLLVVDFDHVIARTIARKLRSERICCKIIDQDTSAEDIVALAPLGLILAGAEKKQGDKAPNNDLFHLQIPMMAFGYPALWLCKMLNGQVKGDAKENKMAEVHFQNVAIHNGMSESDRMLSLVYPLELSNEMRVIADTEEGEVIAFSSVDEKKFGYQMEIEQHDPDSALLLLNFATSICFCTTWWTEDAFVLRSMQEIRRLTGEGTAFCAMTGGLNSGVSALLAHRALSDNFKCVFVDTGLLRKGESAQFLSFYQDEMGLSIKKIDARETFLTALQGVKSGDKKKEIIGALLKDIIEKEMEKIPNVSVIIKGTSYSDQVFKKSAQNTYCGAQEISPLEDLFKDEIRQVGEYLDMPENIITAQPFPGSGLANRILGEVTRERLRVLRTCDHIFVEEMEQSGQNKRLWQYFALLSPMPVDEGHIICLRAVSITDHAKSYAARLPFDLLERVTDKILENCPSVVRVAYDVTPSGRLKGIEWQ